MREEIYDFARRVERYRRIIAVLHLIDFDVREATRGDVERVVAKINGNKSWREETKRHKSPETRTLPSNIIPTWK
ncbi:MAG: hypothetical protein QXR74_04690 [Candidatus Bathyarchaeia archaeon]